MRSTKCSVFLCIHRVVSDISAESLATGGASAVNGTSVVDYLGVGTLASIAVFLLFEQPDGTNPASLADAFR